MVFLDVRHLYIEGDGHQVEDVLFLGVAKLLHHVEQVVLLGDQGVMFEMVDQLPLLKFGPSYTILQRLHPLREAVSCLAEGLNFRLDDCEPFKLDSIGDRLPFKIEHRMHRLYLDPPIPPVQGMPDKLRIISRKHNELIAIFDVRILKRNSALRFFLFYGIAIKVLLNFLLGIHSGKLILKGVKGCKIVVVYILHCFLADHHSDQLNCLFITGVHQHPHPLTLGEAISFS